MSEPPPRLLGRLAVRNTSSPSEREWERATVLEPRAVSREPEFVSDGSGLPFAASLLEPPFQPLDTDDPAVGALLAALARQGKAKPKSSGASKLPWRRGSAPPAPPAPPAPAPAPSLDGWREAARTDEEVLFAAGRMPRLVTVSVRRERRDWSCVAVSSGRPLRATRDGIRASGWRLDPTRELDPADRELRILVTEQTWAGGRWADDRLLAPDLYIGADELVVTTFVTPRQGYQVRSPNPETPARIVLPGPVGSRRVLDGALYGDPDADRRTAGDQGA
jgi:hypothetical protein